jgi:hypothetical protein
MNFNFFEYKNYIIYLIPSVYNYNNIDEYIILYNLNIDILNNIFKEYYHCYYESYKIEKY